MEPRTVAGRSVRRYAWQVVVLALVAQVLVGGGAASARALAIGPGDDRLQTTPTGWWYYVGETPSALASQLSANSARLTDLRVQTVSPLTFTATMVKNSGSYSSGWWWYYGLTASQVNSHVSTNHARIISAQGYDTTSGLRFAVVMVSNTGTNARAWWWYYGTTSYISTQLSTHSARLINFSKISGSTYLGVMVANTTSDATAWWWYYGVSATQVNSYVSTNQARLIDLDRNGDGTFDVVMYRSPSARSYWYYGQSASSLLSKANQRGERLFDVTPYQVSGTWYYAGVMTDNLNALSDKLYSIMAPAIDSGSWGFYLKRVDGSTLASLESGLGFEPASSLKVLYHLKTIRSEQAGSAHDSDSITYHYDPANPTNAGICPDNYASTSTANLKYADTQMMQNSDNRMTKGILDHFGKSAMLSLASSILMTSTAINHDIGCPTSTTHNQTTLSDLSRVYNGVDDGTLVTNSTWLARFKSRMLNQSNYSGFRSSFCPLVSAEATALGKSSTVATNFCNAVNWYAKGGSYQYGGSLPYQISWSGLSVTQLPVKSSGVISFYRDYIFGDFVDMTTINSSAESTAVSNARSQAYLAAMRAQVDAALATW